MGRQPCCEKVGLKRGRWTAEEDEILTKYIQENGEGSWRSLPKNAGLLRCGKSCRLRWINYLRSDLKRGNISAQEEEVIIKLHATLGNKWSVIAGHLQGRTDNEIKNYWNSHLSRKYYSIRRPGTDAGTGTGTETLPPVATANKRRGGRTSRWAMKKNKTYFPIPTKQSDVPKENDNTENPILGPSDIEECIQSLALPSPYQERENPSGASMFGPGEERENGVEENETWWLDEMIPTGIHGEDGLDPNKTWGLTEERENGIGTEIRDGGGETGIFNPSTTSSSTEPLMDFEDGKLGFEWETDWGWEGVVDQGMILGDDENIFSSLWENDNNLEVDCDDKQNAMISWLLS